ncbi:MAG: glycosyltransferase [Tepidisphaeraceae bacterium]|jgi:glycosyltransferase involved in cell wall biosynthesis
MRILHVISSLDPVFGGPPAIAVRLASAQAALGHDVSILHYGTGVSHTKPSDVYSGVAGFDRLHLLTLKPATRLERITGMAARSAIRIALAGSPCDILHLHSLWDAITRASASEADRKGVPYVILLNGVLDPWSLAQKAWKKKLFLALYVRRLLDRAAWIHYGNEDERRLVAPLGLTATAVILPNGVSPQDIENLPAKGSFLGRHPELAGRRYILFFSRLHHKKGLDHLADAFKLVAPRFPDVDLLVAGPDEGARADFELRIREHGLEARTHLVGPVYGADRFALMVDAAVFCLPSRQEGFSMAITEALGAGLPVVVSENCHFPEVRQHDAGHVVPLDSPAIADALADVLADPARAAAMGARGRSLVLARFVWPKVAEMCVEAYRTAINSRHRI